METSIYDLPPAALGDVQAQITTNPSGATPQELRRTVLDAMQAYNTQQRAEIEEHLAARPRRSLDATRAMCTLTDGLVQTAYWFTTQILYPAAKGAKEEPFTILAVGGYGRGIMAPQSDVDLLFLTAAKRSERVENIIEAILYLLWDLRLKVGHSVRSAHECAKLSKSDHTIRTALLEQRPICGDSNMAEALWTTLTEQVFRGTEEEFIAAKLAEREARHIKQGGQRYMVEPNVKEGKGGLRDLQSLFWIAKYYHRVTTAKGLVDIGVLNQDEHDRFAEAEDFLWAVRCHLHFVTNRPNDHLSFPLQIEVAERMKYRDSQGRRGVEHFMHDYFRHATTVGDMTRIYLTSLETARVKAPFLERVFSKRHDIGAQFITLNGRIAFADDTEIFDQPILILELYEHAIESGLLIHPDAMRMIQSNLGVINEALRRNPRAQETFFRMLLNYGNPERALRRMNELGVLAAFIPEFEPIVAMMQFNMYHHYTVDEHTIQTISQLAKIEREELTEDLPLASAILKSETINRKVLYTALICHDIGKGRDEDHSVLGARISRKVTERLGLDERERALVEWLVRNHLVMSDMAQKRDISDPRTVRGFAKSVQTIERLDLLTVLTVCDIRGVGPETWNNWKATLIRQLYRDTRRVLEGQGDDMTRNQLAEDAKSQLRAALVAKGWDDALIEFELDRHYTGYWQGMPNESLVTFAQLLRNLHDTDIAVDLHPDEARDATRVCFALVDHPGIFARITGALSLVGANVVDARTYTSQDGYATAIFWIQDSDESPYSANRLPKLKETIRQTLAGDVLVRDAIEERFKLNARDKAFRVPTLISFDNDGSDIATIIEVDTRDRPALLHDLTRTLANNNVRIVSAVIATYGEQVVDSFYVKDMFGLKIMSQSKQRSLEAKLRDAIRQGAQRANL